MWILVNNMNYAMKRSIAGFEQFYDIETGETAEQEFVKGVTSLGANSKDITVLTDASTNDFKELFRDINR